MATDWEKEAQRAKELKENETFQKILIFHVLRRSQGASRDRDGGKKQSFTSP